MRTQMAQYQRVVEEHSAYDRDEAECLNHEVLCLGQAEIVKMREKKLFPTEQPTSRKSSLKNALKNLSGENLNRVNIV